MIKVILAHVLFLTVCAIPVNGERHKVWRQFGYEAFAAGKAHGIAIAADGTLRPAAALDSFATVDAERIWDLAQGDDGTIYAATGDDGRLYSIDENGASTLLFDSPEVSLHALAIGQDGTLYAGSAPDGIVYKLPRNGQPTVLAHTGSHYVWDLAFDGRGRLYAATGEPANVLRIDADGQIEEVFSPDDRHIISLLFIDDTLYAGSAQKGRVYEVGDGNGRLLFEAAQEEIHALVSDAEGVLYAAAISGEGSDQSTALFRTETSGSTYEWWRDGSAQLRDLARANDALLVATDDGRIVQLNAAAQPSLLAHGDDFKTNRMLRAADESIYLASAHTGQLRRLGPARSEGHYESKVEDVGGHAQWGRVEWRGSGVAVQTRSGNSAEPDATWSDWSTAESQSGAAIESPAARYIQYKVSLKGRDAYLIDLTLYAQRANLPPHIASLEVQPYRTPQARGANQQQQPSAQNQRSTNPPQARSLYLLRWQASDPNDEELVYDLYLRGEDQKQWKKAHEGEERSSLLWDTATMPEGWTQLKLVASDRGQNPPNEALHSERISAPFAIDNSPPRIELKAYDEGRGEVRIEIEISDRISALRKAQYSIDYGDEEYPIGAEDGMYDSRRETAALMLSNLESGEHVIAVQAWDALDNVGAQQIVLRVE